MISKRSKHIKTKKKLKRAQKRVVNKRRINKRSKRKTKKRIKQRGGAEPEMEHEVPTGARAVAVASEVKKSLGLWTEPHCVPYPRAPNESQGAVMILETSDTSGKDIFKTIPIESMEIDRIYQYIMYKIDESRPPELLLVEAYLSPEIGTKHRSLVYRIPDNASILGSGEIVKVSESTYTYSCMSSLFIGKIVPILFPRIEGETTVEYKQKKREWEEAYESETMKEYMKSIFVGSTFTYAKDIRSDVKQPFDPEILCDTRTKPSCIRYVTKEDCTTQLEHPNIGLPNHEIDCRAGEDFCELLERSKSREGVFDSPKAYAIPEIEYIREKVVNVDAATKLLRSKGIVIPKGRVGRSKSRVTKALNAAVSEKNQGEPKITQDEYDSVFEEKIIWPKNV